MTAPTPCRWVASDRPRIVPDRHGEDCPDKQVKPKGAPDVKAACIGCLPCPELHCVMPSCPGRHLGEGEPFVCARCVGAMREDLRELAELCGYRLVDQTLVDGVDSEAAMLLGPAAHPEAWYHRRDSALAGRISADYLDDARDEAHPLFVLGTWEMAWRDWLGHDTDQALTIGLAVSYLNLNLSYVSRQAGMPMGDFATEVRRCRSHLEAVLGDGRERPKDCPKCGGALVMDRDRTDEGTPYEPGRELKAYDDKWRCRNRECREWWTPEDYRARVASIYEGTADRLTASAISRVYRVSESTIRKWAERGHVAKRGADAMGRMLYDVRDVVAMRDRSEVAS